MKITRDVVSDLWPLYEGGEASPDTKAVIEEFLAQDPPFAATLRGGIALPEVEVPMSHTAETLALRRTRDLVQGRSWLRGVRLFALVMTVFALKRLVQETTWTVPPARFIVEAVAATAAWTFYVMALAHQRRKALRAGTANERSA
jgi:hypothetical protein